MLPRNGQHSGYPDTAAGKFVPAMAMLSKFGVKTFGSPLAPVACPRIWSTINQIMFGLFFVMGFISSANWPRSPVYKECSGLAVRWSDLLAVMMG